MIQVIQVQRARGSLLAIGAVALGAAAVVTTLPRLNAPTSLASQPAPVVAQVATELAQRPIVQLQSDKSGCTAYVTGDMAGDASPAEVYAALCGSR